MANYDFIVIGGGPAGLTAALYSARAGKKVLLLEKASTGGQINYAPLVENYPGIPQMSGASFGAALTEQADKFGVEIIYAEATALLPGNPITIKSDDGDFTCKAVIVATGTHHRQLGIDGEEDLIGTGISYCAVCDGAFYEGKKVAVIGGGNSAIQEAIFLSEICEKVTLIHRRNEFRADECIVDRMKARTNIEILTPYVVADILQQDDEVCGLKVTNLSDNNTSTIDVDGVFVAIGQIPETAAFENLGISDEYGYFEADESTYTLVPGVFVAGDCRQKAVRQLTTACADGTNAAMSACEYIDNL